MKTERLAGMESRSLCEWGLAHTSEALVPPWHGGLRTALALPREALMLELAPVLVRDAQERIVYWTRAAEMLYGYTKAEALGRCRHELLRTEFGEPHEGIVARLRAGRRWRGELFQVRSNGARLCVASEWVPHLNGRGELQAIIEISHDITERRRREESLRRAVGELETFSYSLSHDMRAPLRAIRGFAALARELCGPQAGPEAKAYLDRVLSASDHMERLISDVLAFSRISREEITWRPINVEKVVRSILSHHPELQPPQADVRIATPLLAVSGHEASLNQCLTNLLGNAVKYVASGVKPRVLVYTEGVGGKVRLYVQDNGIGIEKEAQEKVFQLFYRHHAGRYEGTGIGLAIVRRAAERMGGQAGVESKPGKGSRFWVELNPAEMLMMP